MSQGDSAWRAGHFFTRWLQRPLRARLPYVVDELSHDDIWIEIGRYATKADAREGMTHLVAGGRDALTLRVAKRPIPSD